MNTFINKFQIDKQGMKNFNKTQDFSQDAGNITLLRKSAFPYRNDLDALKTVQI